jgi:protein-S-isoprenylcysteine O-methyltransferase Ste14
MNSKMKITGSAPIIAGTTFIYFIITVIISSMVKPSFIITEKHYDVLIILGIILIIPGILMVISCGRKLLKSFKNGLLMTDGLYKIFRNPMYAAYMLFIIPGICLLFNSWLVLTTILANYILFSIFIKSEHQYLQEKFGSEYEDYLKNVFIKFL